MDQSAVELIVESQALNANASLIRVPDFVADVWESQSPGTCVGVVDGDVLRISRAQGGLVQKLLGRLERCESDIAVTSLCNGDLDDELPDELQMIAVLEATATYLPDLKDSTYRRYLASQMTSEGTTPPRGPTVLSVEAAKALEQARLRGSNADEGMFKYFREEGVRVAHTSGGVTDVQMEAASAALFRLFESHQGDGLSLRDIQQNVHLPPHHLRRLLEQLTEPQRERLGRKSVFRLKAQYRN